MSHPSFIEVVDLEVCAEVYNLCLRTSDRECPQKYAAEYKVPLLINSCEVDTQYAKEKQDKALELFKDVSYFSQPYFSGCVHGFAVRGDMVSALLHNSAVELRSVQNDPLVKAGFEGAFKNVVDWHKKYL